MNNIEKYSEKTFEDLKHINENGQEFWYARELQVALDYTQWRNFVDAIERAKLACSNSGYRVEDHFADVSKLIKAGKGATRKIDDIMLFRYACYLIVMNGDPRKEIISIGQTYFAIKTRQQELIENYDALTEEQKRLRIRQEMKIHNKSLAETAKRVETPLDYAIFQNFGYEGLYGGLKAHEIKRRKNLKENQDILDNMGSTELAANLFRATQTDEKIKREKIKGKTNANNTHYEVGKKVRETIKELGGTMPEDLPTPEKSIKELEKEEKQKQLKD